MDVPDIVAEFQSVIARQGVHSGLRYLNSRTPHRFTGIYRYDGETLRNVALFDQFSPDQQQGGDVPMADAYCALVGERERSVEFSDIQTDEDVGVRSGSPVISYCGALIRDDQGRPYGTLCHYDVKPCEARTSDAPVLEGIAPMLFNALRNLTKRRDPAA